MPRSWPEEARSKTVSAEAALSRLQSGQRVYIQGGCATPQALVRALVARAADVRGVEIVHLHTEGPAPYTHPDLSASFRHNALFIGKNTREAVNAGRADYTPVFLSEIPGLFSDTLPLDLALVQVSPPDANGFCSLGISVDVAKPAAEAATTVIAQVNPLMPRTHGDSFLHVSQIDCLVPAEEPLLEFEPQAADETAHQIGAHVAALIEDGSCLQMGIGAIPNGVLAALHGHRHLGIHTEMFSDGLLELVEQGIVDNQAKNYHRGKVVTSFIMGTRRLYDFVHDNPMIEMHLVSFTNDPVIIARNEKMVAINSAIEIDLTGQVCADSIGHVFYSGIGGQTDFVRGAAMSRGGKPIIALPSTAASGAVSRIVPELKPGAGVVTSRGDVHWVVTEYGAVNLHGKTVRQRAEALISIAHPAFREELAAAARRLYHTD
ncbi:MAG TPA: acetyl-CoA hydrolase/transferase C-terminal domain-containing protein [Dehalococcoidia bacterium]|nr:acetyl-CoA hydrolase/transferase C-terminal domain-containing protein [Dehalococcoidia bacterium]